MTRILQTLFCIAVSVISIAHPSVTIAQNPRNVIIAVPQLGGKHELVISMTNFLRLKISTLFQIAGTNTRGRMVWIEEPLDPPTHAAAAALGETIDLPHLVFWGTSYRFPDGVAVQPLLSTTGRIWAPVQDGPPPNFWIVDPTGERRRVDAGGPPQLMLTIPRSLYKLPSLLVGEREIVAFPTLEDLPIFETDDMSKEIGRTGTLFRAFEYRTDKVRLTSGSVTGWVSLDRVNERPSAAVEFTSAVFRILRGDFEGAERLLRPLAERKDFSAQFQVDIQLLCGLAVELQGGDGQVFFEKAYASAPLDQVSARFLLQSLLDTALYSENVAEMAKARMRLTELINVVKPLFSPKSRWFQILLSATERL